MCSVSKIIASLSFCLFLSGVGASANASEVKLITGPSFVLKSDVSPPSAVGLPHEDAAEGRLSAPIKLVYFFSLDCTTCADSWKTVRPRLQALAKEGVLRLYYHETYFHEPGWYANLFLNCMPQKNYLTIIDRLFADQNIWGPGGTKEWDYLQTVALANQQNWSKVEACMGASSSQKELRNDRDQIVIYYGLTHFPVYQVWGMPNRYFSKNGVGKIEKSLRALALDAQNMK